MFIVRKSNHINEDIQRNWSSWNYGQEGITATAEQIEMWINEVIENNENPFCISGFELWADEIKESEIKELYPNYWVLVDTRRGAGLSCNILNCDNANDAIAIVSNPNFNVDLSDGPTVSCETAKVIYSNGDVHILEIQ